MKLNKHLFAVLAFILIACSKDDAVTNELNIAPNQYGLKVISRYEDYTATIKADSNNRLMNLEAIIPGVQLDIRYATANNFTGQKVYDSAMAFLRLAPAKALQQVQNELKAQNLGLRVYDAYRPYTITIKFYEIYKDTNFVAAPWLGSRHNRGCAVDVSLIDLSTQQEIPMPTEYDDFTAKAKPDYADLPDSVKANRKLLIDIMAKYNFEVHHSEWWHFDYTGWDKYYLMDIPFRQL